MTWTLEIDIDALKATAQHVAAMTSALGPEDFPYYFEESEAVSEHAEQLYVGYLMGKPMPNGKAISNPAKNAAEGVMRKASGMLQWDLINTSNDAQNIEEGTPERDMKAGLPYYKKTRQAKDGTLYLIVPFRHGNPSAKYLQPMPKHVYKLAKQLEYSQHLGVVGSRISATGHKVPVFGYKWKGSLPEGLAPKAKPHHVTDLYAGMYRMNKAKHTEYITFRTMSQKSVGWVKKATPGFYPMQTAIQTAMDEGMAGLSAALQADLVNMLTP